MGKNRWTSENFNKELEIIKKNQSELKNTITEMKNILEGINCRITETEKWISESEDKMVGITVEEQNEEKRTKIIEDRLREPWDSIKHSTIQIIGASGEKENVCENIFEDSRKLS